MKTYTIEVPVSVQSSDELSSSHTVKVNIKASTAQDAAYLFGALMSIQAEKMTREYRTPFLNLLQEEIKANEGQLTPRAIFLLSNLLEHLDAKETSDAMGLPIASRKPLNELELDEGPENGN